MTERTPTRIAAIALACSLMLAAIGLTSASWTGASVMMAIAVQAIVAACHQAFLLKTLRDENGAPAKSASSPDQQFVSYAVPVLLYALGAGVALSEGTATLHSPREVVSPLIDVMALAFAIGIEGAALILTLAFLHSGPDAAAATASPPKSPPMKALLIEHAGAIASLLIASLGVAFLALLEVPIADATAAIVVGLVMALIATVMSLEVRRALMRGDMRRGTMTLPIAASPALSSEAPTASAAAPISEPARHSNAVDEVSLRLSRKDKKRHKRHRA